MVGINIISDNVARRICTSPQEAKKVIVALLETIIEEVNEGNVVRIQDLGIFQRRPMKAMRVKSVKGGKIIQIPPRKKLVFEPTYKIKYL